MARSLRLPAVLATLVLSSLPAAHAAAPRSDPFPVIATDACASGPWLIPFAAGVAELTDFARGRLDQLAAAWHLDEGPVLASGHTDGAELNTPGLAARRLAVVAAALADRGVPPDIVWSRDEGSGHGLVDDKPGVPEPQNRIVEVELARGGEACATRLLQARLSWLHRNCAPSHPKAGIQACDSAMREID